MEDKQMAAALRRLLEIRVVPSGIPGGAQDHRATLSAMRAAIHALVEVLEVSRGTPAETIEEHDSE